MVFRVIFLVLFLFVTLVDVCPAGDSPHKLDEIVVTASRIESPLRETPVSITVITGQEIKEKGAQTLVDVFNDEPGVFTTSILNNPKFSSIDIRGFGSTSAQNSLFLVDGIRLNNIDMSGADLSQIPIEIVERVEIYKGPASVLFGDNAVGGVVNIILKKGEGEPKIKAGFKTGSYGLYNPYISAFGKQGKLSFYSLASSYDTSGYRHNNTLRAKDLAGQLSFEATKDFILTMRFGHHTDRYGLPGPLTLADLETGLYDRKDSKTPFDKSSTEDNSFDLGAQINIVKDISLYLNGSYRKRHESFSYTMTFGSWDSMRKFETWSLTPKIAIKKDIFGLKNVFLCGMDYYKYPTESRDFSPGTSSSTEVDKTEYGFYANDEIHLMENLLFNMGYRVAKAKYEFDYRDHTGVLKPVTGSTWEKKDALRVGLSYVFGEEKSVFLTYATGFRFPATDELFSPWSDPPISSSLEPQTVREIDVGVRWDFNRNVGGYLTLFQSRNKNEIYYNQLTFTNENYKKTKRQGLEARLFLLATKDLKADLGYSYTKAKFGGGMFDGNGIPLVPAHKLSGKITYAFKDFTFLFMANYTGKQYMISDLQNRFRTLPGVTTFDTNILYKYKDKLGVSFSVKNLTNKEYSGYGVVSNDTSAVNLYPSPGRQYVLELEYTL